MRNKHERTLENGYKMRRRGRSKEHPGTSINGSSLFKIEGTPAKGVSKRRVNEVLQDTHGEAMSLRGSLPELSKEQKIKEVQERMFEAEERQTLRQH